MRPSLSVKSLPASNGDSTLISYGKTSTQQKHILVDCVYASTYNDYLYPVLSGLADRGEQLELLIITHIDADHILGAIPLLKQPAPGLIPIAMIWHNTFRHLFEHLPGTSAPSVSDNRIIKRILERGFQAKGKTIAETTISTRQGSTVGALILKGNYNWNKDFGGESVNTDYQQNISLIDGAKIYLLSPDSSKLNDLRRYWQRELMKYDLGYKAGDPALYDDAFEMLMSWERMKKPMSPKPISSSSSPVQLALTKHQEDQTVTNGSSIAFIFSFEQKKLLMLADAHPSLILTALNRYQPIGVIWFDLIKVAHHGSFANSSPALLHRIDAVKYLFSGNGEKYGHPDRETIALSSHVRLPLPVICTLIIAQLIPIFLTD